MIFLSILIMTSALFIFIFINPSLIYISRNDSRFKMFHMGYFIISFINYLSQALLIYSNIKFYPLLILFFIDLLLFSKLEEKQSPDKRINNVFIYNKTLQYRLLLNFLTTFILWIIYLIQYLL